MPTTPTVLHRGEPPHRIYWILPIVAVLLIAAAVVVESDWSFGSSSSSAVQGSGIAATETRDLSPFSAVELAGVNDVSVRVGNAQTVTVTADDNVIERITTDVQDGVLVIATQGSVTNLTPTIVDVTVPSLESVNLTGTGALVVEKIRTDELEITVSGTGAIRASGAVGELRVSLSGTGAAGLGELSARMVEASVSGSGQIMVTATESLDASVSGTGSILYRGNPVDVTKSVTGAGAIIEE